VVVGCGLGLVVVVVGAEVVEEPSGGSVVEVVVVDDDDVVVVPWGSSAAAGQETASVATAARSAPARAREGWSTGEPFRREVSDAASVTGSQCDALHLNTGQARPYAGGVGTTIDKDALKAKYAEEREKRLRADGNEQYIRLTGTWAHYLEDPYTPVVEREPLTDHVTVAFIGGGFAGLVTGARLKEAGVDDVRIIEKGGDFGGTWYWNR
jgi:hypothetical protein